MHNVLYLQNGVVLTLMHAIDNAGTPQGVSIRYQVISPLRLVSRDLELGKYAAPPR
ncbi:MAG: hypothetical protein ABI137_05260 [Antricoccus sp.]